MAFSIYSGNSINGLDIPPVFHTRQYCFDESFDMLELIASCLAKVNENVSAINSMESSITAFQTYVNTQIDGLSAEIQAQVNIQIQALIDDGTILNLIKTTYIDGINNTITSIQNSIITTNNNLQAEIDAINYIKPSAILSISPSNLIYNTGETINSVILNSVITKGSKDITEIKYYKNGVQIQDKTTGITLNDSFTDANIISSDVTYYAEVSDGTSTVKTNEITINFVTHFYHGLIADTDTVSETLIKSLTALKVLKSNLSETYSPNFQKILFAFPTSYGSLNSINDSEGIDCIDGFISGGLNLTLNGVTVPYTYYVSDYSIIDTNATFTFEF